jgi:hypothetical protein
MKFIKRLENLLKQFDIDQAVVLSDQIQNAEENGYEISTREDRLWVNLTTKIMKYNE